MKKWVLGVLILAVVVVIGSFFVDAHPFNYDPDAETGDYYPYHMRGGMRGGYCLDEDDFDYEFLYQHLSSEDQAIIDQMYLERIAAIDFDLMTDEESLAEITSIKEELAQYILDNDMFTYYYGYQPD